MTLLSDVDIKREIGNNILIYPYKNKNLKGASYNLTPSQLAWDLKTKATIYDPSTKTIVIHPRRTALIETFETVWVSPKIAGTYHSRVSQVSQGAGHIGTTVDPNYIGPSLISVHNHNDTEPIQLVVGEDSLVTLAFQYVHTDSSIEQHANYPGRIEILNQVGIRPTADEQRWLGQSFMNSREALRAELKKCKDYKAIERERESQVQKFSLQKLYIGLGIMTIALIFIAATLSAQRVGLGQLPWFTPATFIVEKSIEGIAVVWITLITNRILNKKK